MYSDCKLGRFVSRKFGALIFALLAKIWPSLRESALKWRPRSLSSGRIVKAETRKLRCSGAARPLLAATKLRNQAAALKRGSSGKPIVGGLISQVAGAICFSNTELRAYSAGERLPVHICPDRYWQPPEAARPPVDHIHLVGRFNFGLGQLA